MSAHIASKILHRLPMRVQLKAELLLSRLCLRLLGTFAQAVLTNTWNGQLLVSSTDFVVGKTLAFDGQYDIDGVKFLLGKINPTSTVLVVGTHVGALVVPLAKKAKHLIGIEANPETYQLLSMNLILNDLHNVKALNFAAGEKTGNIDFLVNKHNTGGSKALHNAIARDPLYYYDAPETVKVPMRALDEVFPEETFDLIVMDIEGSEFFALKGMDAILRRSRVLQIEMCAYVIEHLGHTSVEEFVKLLGNLLQGFRSLAA